MAKQMDADEIAGQIYGLEEKIRKDLIAEIIDLVSGPDFLPLEDEDDTFDDGRKAVIKAIRANF